MGILCCDLYAHVDNPEALVVGVVSDCPAELLLGVQQPVGTSRSVNWNKIMFQDLIRYPVLTLCLDKLIYPTRQWLD